MIEGIGIFQFMILRPVLVVCPSSVRLNWKAEYLQWMDPHIKDEEVNVILNGKQSIRLDPNPKDLYLKVVIISL